MFALHNIQITNFRSYRGAHQFEFPKADGLYFLTGENLAEPGLGANGAGKSTLLDAITWALYGRTTRGLRSNEVLSWGSPTCKVTLELTIGDRRCVLKRTQKPISLTLDDKPVDQEELQKYLRLNCESFLYSVINTQFGKSFMGLSPSEKLTLFSDIKNLDPWLHRSDEAAKQSADLQAEIDAFQAELNTYQNKVGILNADMEILQKTSDEFEVTKHSKLDALQDRIAGVTSECLEISQSTASLEKEKKYAQGRLNVISADLKKYTPSKNKLVEKINALESQKLAIASELKLLLRQIDALSGIDADCPTCLQPVHETYLDNERGVLIAKRDFAQLGLAELDRKLKPLRSEVATLQGSIDTEIVDSEELWAEVQELNIKLARNPVKLAAANDRLKELEVQIKGVNKDKNPHTTMIATKQAKVKKLEKEIAECTGLKDELEAEFAATNFWVKGFKRVRLFIIEEAFRTLEVEVNNSLTQLGMSDWEITFDVERENKSGGITKGFLTFVRGPDNPEPVRWESWSGGETQRLQLAGDLGLANLIMQSQGLANTIEFYDEPSTHLSPEGMVDLANMLHERAVTEGKRIWIVDHAAITNFGEFKGIITARKTANGSNISYSEL